MKTLILILFMTVSYCNNYNNFSFKDGYIYIYEYAIKIPGQANVGFIIINDTSIIQKIDFKIYYSKRKVEKVIKYDGLKGAKFLFSKKENGNIFIEELSKLCYNSENFISRNKFISDDIYKMISPNFLKITNEERLKILDNLVK